MFEKEELRELAARMYNDWSVPKIEQYMPLKDIEIRKDDVFLIGLAKSGTTWAQEMIWLIANDLDYEGAKVFIDERFPNLELAIHVGMHTTFKLPECDSNSVEFVKKMKSPRFIKSHLGPKMLPNQLLNDEKKPKIIYVARNPKDVCVSLYYYMKDVLNMSMCSLDDYCKLFMSDLGSFENYWEHLLYFWNRRHENNILFIKYEEMKSNLLEVIRRVAHFLEKSLTMEQEQTLMKWLDFDSIRNNPAVNHENLYQKGGFIRKGNVGDHKTEISPEILNYFDIWINESSKNTDYKV